MDISQVSQVSVSRVWGVLFGNVSLYLVDLYADCNDNFTLNPISVCKANYYTTRLPRIILALPTIVFGQGARALILSIQMIDRQSPRLRPVQMLRGAPRQSQLWVSVLWVHVVPMPLKKGCGMPCI